jgi:hypothetical protein
MDVSTALVGVLRNIVLNDKAKMNDYLFESGGEKMTFFKEVFS